MRERERNGEGERGEKGKLQCEKRERVRKNGGKSEREVKRVRE